MALLACKPTPANTGQDRGPCNTTLTAGLQHTCSLVDGNVQCWGDNAFAELGLNPSTHGSSDVPAPVITGFLAPVATIAAAADGEFTCALLTTGAVECWGADGTGQLGAWVGLAGHLATPTAVALSQPATAIAAGSADGSGELLGTGQGGGFACALTNSEVQCWGQIFIAAGQNAAGTVPITISGVSGASAIAAGAATACAIVGTQGTVWCWGDNNFDELGNGGVQSTYSTTAAQVVGITGATAIAVGNTFACALVNGSVWCWGDNRKNQLGDTTVSQMQSPTPRHVANLTGVQALVAGGDFACAEDAQSTLWCWGANDSGQLGDGSMGGTSATPVKVANVIDPVALTLGAAHGCVFAFGPGASPSCWGDNGAGQLGNGSTSGSASPVQVSQLTQPLVCVAGPGPTASVTDARAPACAPIPPVAAGKDFTCALGPTGVGCWGDNTRGQLGITGGNTLTPPTGGQGVVQNFLGDVSTIAAASGGEFTCAITTGGSVECWGADTDGELGSLSGSPYFSSSPSAVALSGPAKAITAGSIDGGGYPARNGPGGGYACALLMDGSVQCWGGVYTDANLGIAGPTPFTIPGLSGATAIAGGAVSTCALKGDGSVWCWGDNNFGELGNGSVLTTYSMSPVQVAGLSGATAIAVGNSFACAIAQGAVFCWGDSSKNQIGNAAIGPGAMTTYSSTPMQVQIANPSPAVLLAAGGFFACLSLADGTVWCWGDDQHQELGVILTGFTSGGPVQLPVVSSPAALVAGESHFCAVGADGSLQCWGDDTTGQIGNGTTSNASPITSVLGSSSVSLIYDCPVQYGHPTPPPLFEGGPPPFDGGPPPYDGGPPPFDSGPPPYDGGPPPPMDGGPMAPSRELVTGLGNGGSLQLIGLVPPGTIGVAAFETGGSTPGMGWQSGSPLPPAVPFSFLATGNAGNLLDVFGLGTSNGFAYVGASQDGAGVWSAGALLPSQSIPFSMIVTGQVAAQGLQVIGLGRNDGHAYIAASQGSGNTWNAGSLLAGQTVALSELLAGQGTDFSGYPTLLVIGLGASDGHAYLAASQSNTGTWSIGSSLPNQTVAFSTLAAGPGGNVSKPAFQIVGLGASDGLPYLAAWQDNMDTWYGGFPLTAQTVPMSSIAAALGSDTTGAKALQVVGLGKADGLPYVATWQNANGNWNPNSIGWVDSSGTSHAPSVPLPNPGVPLSDLVVMNANGALQVFALSRAPRGGGAGAVSPYLVTYQVAGEWYPGFQVP